METTIFLECITLILVLASVWAIKEINKSLKDSKIDLFPNLEKAFDEARKRRNERIKRNG